MKSIVYILFIIFFVSLKVQAQKDSTKVKTKQLQLKPVVYNPLSPSRAAFYSAILPGAGQIYNNRYWWQLPLIYGGLGYSIYSYIDNSNAYDRYRTAYKQRQAGLTDEFSGLISDTGLENAQEQFSTNRDLSLLSAVLVYVLQIVEASVTSHLLQFDTSKDLSVRPMITPNYNLVDSPNVGVTLKYTF